MRWNPSASVLVFLLAGFTFPQWPLIDRRLPFSFMPATLSNCLPAIRKCFLLKQLAIRDGNSSTTSTRAKRSETDSRDERLGAFQPMDRRDRLRGNLDTTVYKHAVLGLNFPKYVSDSFAMRQREIEVPSSATRRVTEITKGAN